MDRLSPVENTNKSQGTLQTHPGPQTVDQHRSNSPRTAMTAAQVMQLQKTIGNRAVTQMFHARQGGHFQSNRNAAQRNVIQCDFDANRPAYRGFLTDRNMVDSSEARAKFLEWKDQGHSLREHGPDQSDGKLKGRLENGMKGAGGVWKSVRISAKFNSYDAYLETREAAVRKMKLALEKTKQHLAYAIQVWQDSDRGQGVQVVRSEIAKLPADALPVKWDGAKSTIVLYRTYEVFQKFGTAVGRGFEGIEGRELKKVQKNNNGEDVEIDIYKNKGIQELPELKYTKTAFNLGVNFDLEETEDSSIDNWTVGQHFPAKAEGESIAASDYDQPYRDHVDNPWEE